MLGYTPLPNSNCSRWYASYWNAFLLLPTNEVCKGYVFTGVCLSTGGVSAPFYAGIHTPMSRCPHEQMPPRQTPPWEDTPWADTPPLHSACWDTVNKQAVRIPLECIFVLKCVYTAQHPESHRDYDRSTDTDKLTQNPKMGICVEVCLCAVWPPPHNSIQPISYQSLYRSRWLAVWKHHKSGSVALWKEILSRDTIARDKVLQTNSMLFLKNIFRDSGPLTAQKQTSSLIYMQGINITSLELYLHN